MTSPVAERELKYLIGRSALERFLAAVADRVACQIHDPARPVAFTRTTYLDTAAGRYLRSVAPRRRLRVREYAAAATGADEPVLTGASFLELKESEGSIRRKVRWRAPAGVIRALVGCAGCGPLERAVPAEILERLRVDRPRPVATTWYRRRAFVALGVRITADDPPWLCSPVGAGLGAARPMAPVAVLPGPVLEVKVRGEMPAWLALALGGLPAPQSVSKFRLAVSALGPREDTDGLL